MLRPGASGAALFGIYAAVAYDVMSSTNSSPQTTELFAADRAVTLWKYVQMGDMQIAGFAVLGAVLAPAGEWIWPVAGAALAGLIMHCMYAHALASGQAAAPGAEQGAGLKQAMWRPAP